MSIAENIKKIRLEHELSQADLGRIAGVSDKAVSTWELGIKVPRMGAVEKLANYFGIPKSAIVDDAPVAASNPIPAGFQPMPEMDLVPLVGRIACGTPITAEENVERRVCVPANGVRLLHSLVRATAWNRRFMTVIWLLSVVNLLLKMVRSRRYELGKKLL